MNPSSPERVQSLVQCISCRDVAEVDRQARLSKASVAEDRVDLKLAEVDRSAFKRCSDSEYSIREDRYTLT